MSDEEFFRRSEAKREPFNPVSNEWQEVHWGETPLGGDVSIAYYYDKEGNHCTKENMAYMDIVIYTKDGTYVNSVMGANPYRQRRPSL